MNKPTIPHGTLSPFELRSLGEMLRDQYHLPGTLPSHLYGLVMKLDRRDGDERELPAWKESDYRLRAVETMRLAEHASSSFVKARLVDLAEAWIELAERVHKAKRWFRS
jgi:hypothetical protein